jgi:hypothetical protein
VDTVTGHLGYRGRMRLPPVPAPQDVVRLVGRGTGAVNDLLDAVPRFVRLLDEAERLLQRASEALDQLDATRVAADELVRRTDGIVNRAEGSLARTDGLVTDAAETLTRTDSAVTDAVKTLARTEEAVTGGANALARTDAVVTGAEKRAVTSIEGLADRALRLLAATEPALVKLTPTLDRLAETTHPQEVDALVTLVDHLPDLVGRFEGEVLPILNSMRTVGPDIHDLLDLTSALNEMLGSVPGLGRIKKRIDEEQEEGGG